MSPTSMFRCASALALAWLMPTCAVWGQPGGEGGDSFGACCITCPATSKQTACAVLTRSQCDAQRGRFRGDGTRCAPAPRSGACSCEVSMEARVAVNPVLIAPDPGSIDQPITAPGGGGCLNSCVPNRFAKFSIGVKVRELRTSGPTLGPGYGCIGFMLSASPLTARGAYGAGMPLPGSPCPLSDQPPVGIVWPFRDGLESPPAGTPCMPANNLNIVMDTFECGFEARVEGEIHGGPLEPLPGYPMSPDVYTRGHFDQFGNVLMASLRMRPMSGPQRPVLFSITGGLADVISIPDGDTAPMLTRNVPVEETSFIRILPGFDDPSPNGAAINGLAAIELGEYDFPPLIVQNTQTSAGDKAAPAFGTERSEGSELDGLYARVETEDAGGNPIPPRLRLFISGNLKSRLLSGISDVHPDWDNLEIFIDSIDGQGQNVLRGDNSSIDDNALNRMGEKSVSNGNTAPGPNGRGLAFEPGCAPDFYTNVSLRTANGFDYDLFVHHAELPSGGGGQGWLVGTLDDDLFLTADGALSGGDAGAPAIRASMSNANFAGVVAGTGAAPFEGDESGLDVVTGVELAIPLEAIGNPNGTIRLVAFLTRKDHGFIYNQVLPGIGSGSSLGEPRGVDFSLVGGMQCATLYPGKNPLWKNGDFDRRDAQTSQVGADQDWNAFSRITADDFYLCDGQIHAIDSVTGSLTTDAAVPKALITIWADCNGRPDITRPLAVLSSAPQVFEGRPIEANDGEVFIRETGDVFDGFRIIAVEGRFAKPVYLRGGAYWVSIIGFSGTGNPSEQFFWGTAGGASGDPVVKGRPGQFYDSEVGYWEDIDLLCCGCTDFNFCIGGESCKLLFDNASPLLNFDGSGPGTPSLQNGANTATRSRSASDIVLPPCGRQEICYIEGYVWTNCPRVALQFFEPGCSCPSDTRVGSEPYLADCTTDTGHRYQIPGTGIELRLLKAQFFRFPALALPPGKNLWVSLYALGDNTQNGRGYFAFGDRCNRPCDVLFNGPCVRGPAFDTGRWRHPDTAPCIFDHALAVAVREAREVLPGASAPACPADTNRDGALSVQDLFDFLGAWFAGCP